MTMINKTIVFGGLLTGLILLTTGCTFDNRFRQESAEEAAMDLDAESSAEAGSSGAGATGAVAVDTTGGGAGGAGGAKGAGEGSAGKGGR